ncbi:hypothetical protein ACWT_5535 [Actinoplanes sp. SE50]|uniref:hypothetical protein n=1 Tax=unclassified Actinoplanes TaxID=2626549 RepID=UPI00023ECB9B|nr:MULTISPECIES: hypothetical protein [unclassified Actinoplanes]AEV86552.1 hypothetical protein ACPL_5665 [Actinoplanes sp. SE50/110]ATO84950.1 hypothetical protein ACWT_5535 [Actinoplanes sp. SE50]SLM02359.1 uncharacterized protein ACSP50_5598 [Actinoplanes sp. SE50/110]
MRRLSPVFALFFLSPLVGEFFLGDFAITLLPLIFVFAPMYGGAAVLIREVTRRTGRGWPTIVTLALAYGVLEEGLITQSLFNKDYLDQHLLDPGYIPAIGTALPWVVFVLTLHTVWSISVPISLVEESSTRRTRPWLGRIGLTVITVLMLGGGFAVFNATRTDPSLSHGFLESSPQALSIVGIAVVLIVVAFLLPRPAATEPAARPVPGTAPGPWVVLATGILAGLLFMSVTWSIVPTVPGVVLMLVATLGTAVVVSRWARRAGWGPWHRFAITAAALLTYTWHTFFAHSAGFVLDLISHLVYAAAALAILWYVARRIRAKAPLGETDRLHAVG